MCLVPLPADTASVDNPSTRTITLPGPSFLDSTTMKISIFRIPGCAHLTFQAIDVPGPSFLDSTTMKISIFRIPGCAHLTFQAIDVGVFGAASRGHRKRRQSFDADNYVARSILPGLNNNEDFNLQNSGVRALDFPGHRWVRRAWPSFTDANEGEHERRGSRPRHE